MRLQKGHQTGGDVPRVVAEPRSRSNSGTVVGGGGVGWVGEESQGRLTDKETEGPGSQLTRGGPEEGEAVPMTPGSG